MTRAIAILGGSFVLSVLWFDLKFDNLALDSWLTDSAIAEPALTVIRSYYTQALTTENAGFPLIITMMVIAIISTLLQLRDQSIALWVRILALLLVIPPVSLAGIRVVPNAQLLAGGALNTAEQSDLAILILQDHLYCFASIFAFLLLQMIMVWKEKR